MPVIARYFTKKRQNVGANCVKFIEDHTVTDKNVAQGVQLRFIGDDARYLCGIINYHTYYQLLYLPGDGVAAAAAVMTYKQTDAIRL